MKVIDYLYYKLYRSALQSSLKDVPGVAAATWLSLLVCVNILEISGFLSKVTALPFIFRSSKQGSIVILFLIFAMTFYYRKKRDEIIAKFSKENEQTRKKGNAIVALYVGISLLLIFAVAFFRTGKS